MSCHVLAVLAVGHQAAEYFPANDSDCGGGGHDRHVAVMNHSR